MAATVWTKSTKVEEPWRKGKIGSDYVGNDNGPIIKVVAGVGAQGVEDVMRRVVACINACKGIKTEDLEKHGAAAIRRYTVDREQQLFGKTDDRNNQSERNCDLPLHRGDPAEEPGECQPAPGKLC